MGPAHSDGDESARRRDRETGPSPSSRFELLRSSQLFPSVVREQLQHQSFSSPTISASTGTIRCSTLETAPASSPRISLAFSLSLNTQQGTHLTPPQLSRPTFPFLLFRRISDNALHPRDGNPSYEGKVLSPRVSRSIALAAVGGELGETIGLSFDVRAEGGPNVEVEEEAVGGSRDREGARGAALQARKRV